jgi:hypothetical protein
MPKPNDAAQPAPYSMAAAGRGKRDYLSSWWKIALLHHGKNAIQQV